MDLVFFFKLKKKVAARGLPSLGLGLDCFCCPSKRESPWILRAGKSSSLSHGELREIIYRSIESMMVYCSSFHGGSFHGKL